jgi:hypothetical protein
MEEQRRHIFRADAMRRLGANRERTVLPRFVSPRLVAGVWMLLLLLAACGALAWLARIPVYTSGSAVIYDRYTRVSSERDGLGVVAFLPPESLTRLRAGQTALLQLNSGQRLRSQIFYVEPEVKSPAQVRQLFALDAAAGALVTQPSVVAVAQLETQPDMLPTHAYAGSIARIEVETGTRRVISLLPLVGRFFRD